MKITKKYFDKEYWTKGTKSGYTDVNYALSDYLHRAKADFLVELYDYNGISIHWLEAGCAYGDVVYNLRKEYGIQVTGFDISKYAIKQAPKRFNDIAIKHSLYVSDGLKRQTITGNYYALIYSFETAEHVYEKDVPIWLGNLYYWLRPGGKLFMTICLGNDNIRGIDDNDKSHQTLQPRNWWDAQLKNVGFQPDFDAFEKAKNIEVDNKQVQFEKKVNIIKEYNLHHFCYIKP